MKRTIGILVFDNVEVLDFAGPFEVFSVASELHDYSLFEVKLISKSGTAISAANGLSVNPDFSLENCPSIDILIVPGGAGTRQLIKDKEVLDWISSVLPDLEFVLSICTGSMILGQLGLLDGQPYCTHNEVYKDMESMFPKAVPMQASRYVQSGERVFTSGGISAGIDLSFHVLENLHGKEVAWKTARYMEYTGYGIVD